MMAMFICQLIRNSHWKITIAWKMLTKVVTKNKLSFTASRFLTASKRFAKDINKKYLNPPETTNFGIMFLPTEGLYSEVVRNASFFDSLRRDENIVVAGPSTLSALLNSLAVGFKTLNIQKNANDISKVLGNVKVEFEKIWQYVG